MCRHRRLYAESRPPQHPLAEWTNRCNPRLKHAVPITGPKGQCPWWPPKTSTEVGANNTCMDSLHCLGSKFQSSMCILWHSVHTLQPGISKECCSNMYIDKYSGCTTDKPLKMLNMTINAAKIQKFALHGMLQEVPKLPWEQPGPLSINPVLDMYMMQKCPWAMQYVPSSTEEKENRLI